MRAGVKGAGVWVKGKDGREGFHEAPSHRWEDDYWHVRLKSFKDSMALPQLLIRSRKKDHFATRRRTLGIKVCKGVLSIGDC